MVKECDWDKIGRIVVMHSIELGKLQEFAEISRMGFEYASNYCDFRDKLKWEPKPNDEPLTNYAKSQLPKLHDLNQLICFKLWSIVEIFCTDIIKLLIQTKSVTLPNDFNIKIEASSLFSENDSEWASHIFRKLENHLNSSFKSGINRFESIFELLGYQSSVEKSVKDNLFYCNKYRNCIAHSCGIIDKALADAIPAFEQSVGNRLGVMAHENRAFIYSICWYFGEIQSRILPDDFPHKDRITAEQQEMLKLLASDDKTKNTLLAAPLADVTAEAKPPTKS